jgi:predicted RNase H-like HicB family nuclease
MKLKVLIYPEEEGGFSVAVPALPGCYSDAETLEEARANAREAAECWLDGALQFQVRTDEDAALADQLREWRLESAGPDAVIEEINVEADWERARR